MEEVNPELDHFRQQWRAEVLAKAQREVSKSKTSKSSRRPPPITSLASSSNQTVKPLRDEEEAAPMFTGYNATREEREAANGSKSGAMEPVSALEHYERAVEREAQGSLGDSLDLYRKAFRMDDKVDQKYKSKHFPPSDIAAKPTDTNPAGAAVTVPNTAHHSLDGPPKNIKDLIASFSGMTIEPAPPLIEDTPPPRCPIAELPEEILVHIMTDLAIVDIASFARMAQVCKRMAYLVSSEEQIWKRVCLGSEVGFGGMHYQWQKDVLGGVLQDSFDSDDDNAILPPSKDIITASLLQTTYLLSYRHMFRTRPRIRFNGCYISTVNYMRPGQASASQITWNSPVHIVTYYRYLRFFRDGTVISLLSTTEPADVVHYLTKDMQEFHRHGAQPHLPSIVMKNALRGRWRLSTITDYEDPDTVPKDAEGDLYIETEGASPKYLYRMKLRIGSAGKAARNNKLLWQGFWNYNLLTDDSGEFTLRNDKAFFWSRVKSYGDGA